MPSDAMPSEPAAITSPTTDLAAARTSFASFVFAQPRDHRTLVFHDADADGVTAAIVLVRALERLGFTSIERMATARERDAWSPANRERIAAAAPSSLFVLDLGTRPQPLAPGVATCLIDHHHPDGVAPGATLISGYGWDPCPNTSLLAYDVCTPLVDLSDSDWIAAIGVLSDLGERAPFALLADVRGKYPMAQLKEVTTLVNAVRRASHFDAEPAARALLSHRSPRELLDSTGDDVMRLREAREEVKVAMNEAKKAAPLFAGNVALIRVHSRCQVHPLIAQIWRTRLPKYIVMVANDMYVEGRVNFSMRSTKSTNLINFLRAIDLGEGDGSFGHGHDQATGGSLPVARWNLLLEKLGFPSTAFA
jgi:single-stranded-DNA-specific exonuclease